MAITAAITLTPSTVKAQQPFQVRCTVSNSGGAAVNVVSIRPLIYPAGQLVTDGMSAAANGVLFGGPGANRVVPAAGALDVFWSDVVFVPQGGYWAQGGTSQIWTVGAIVYCDDGSVTGATTANETVQNYP